MVQPLDHVSVGLLFALPAWLLWDRRTGAAFVAFVVLTSRLPDVDLRLQALGLPVKHHGVTHTVVFVIGFALVAGFVLTAVFGRVLRRWWRLTENEDVNRETIYAFVTGGLALGGLSHLLADALAADWAEPIEPFWPILETSVELGIVSYDSPWVNLGLFVLAVGLHVPLIVSELVPLETRVKTGLSNFRTSTRSTDGSALTLRQRGVSDFGLGEPANLSPGDCALDGHPRGACKVRRRNWKPRGLPPGRFTRLRR